MQAAILKAALFYHVGIRNYVFELAAFAFKQATKQIEDNHGNKVLNNLIVFTDGKLWHSPGG